jgi:hypothetical protein
MSAAVSDAISTMRSEMEPQFHFLILFANATTGEISGRCEPPNDIKGD